MLKLVAAVVMTASLSACANTSLNEGNVLYSRIHTVPVDLTPTGCEEDCVHNVTFRLICLDDGVTASMAVIRQPDDIFDQLNDVGKWRLHAVMMKQADAACSVVWENDFHVQPDLF